MAFHRTAGLGCAEAKSAQLRIERIAKHIIAAVIGISSLCTLGVLCVSVVKKRRRTRTTETQRTLRLHREEASHWLLRAGPNFKLQSFGFRDINYLGLQPSAPLRKSFLENIFASCPLNCLDQLTR